MRSIIFIICIPFWIIKFAIFLMIAVMMLFFGAILIVCNESTEQGVKNAIIEKWNDFFGDS